MKLKKKKPVKIKTSTAVKMCMQSGGCADIPPKLDF